MKYGTCCSYTGSCDVCHVVLTAVLDTVSRGLSPGLTYRCSNMDGAHRSQMFCQMQELCCRFVACAIVSPSFCSIPRRATAGRIARGKACQPCGMPQHQRNHLAGVTCVRGCSSR